MERKAGRQLYLRLHPLPYLSFASNFMWVMVIGLLGPSIPGIIMDLGISYTKAGLFFTLLSLGSLLGTSLGGFASDYLNRKILYSGIALVLSAGLVCVGLALSYSLILLFIFLLGLAGSPAGTVGQSYFPGSAGHGERDSVRMRFPGWHGLPSCNWSSRLDDGYPALLFPDRFYCTGTAN